MTTKLETHLRTYTVFGVYKGCADRYASVIKARGPMEALALAHEEWQDNNGDAETPVRLCGVVTGNHAALDAAYAKPGWAPEEVLEHRRAMDLSAESPPHNQYTVIAIDGAWQVTASDPFGAELMFDPKMVAAVVAGDVTNDYAHVVAIQNS